MGPHQQMMRIDHEDALPCDPSVKQRFLRAASSAIEAADVVVLSDYGKGVFSDEFLRHVIGEARASGKTILADPKRRDFSLYQGVSILTPNRKELSDATGLPCETDEEATIAAARAREACGAAVLLTRSEKGMSYFPTNGQPLHLATVAQHVFDGSGAGRYGGGRVGRLYGGWRPHPRCDANGQSRRGHRGLQARHGLRDARRARRFTRV